MIYIPFQSRIQWPYLDAGALGINKGLIGLDLVGSGDVQIQIAFNQADITSFSDQPGFATSLSVTPVYEIALMDTVPGEPMPFPINAPSYSLILTLSSEQQSGEPWEWEAANLYVNDQYGGGATG